MLCQMTGEVILSDLPKWQMLIACKHGKCLASSVTFTTLVIIVFCHLLPRNVTQANKLTTEYILSLFYQ